MFSLCTDDNDGNHMAQRKLKQRFDDIVSIIGRQQQSVPKISRPTLSNRPIDLYRNFFLYLSIFSPVNENEKILNIVIRKIIILKQVLQFFLTRLY